MEHRDLKEINQKTGLISEEELEQDLVGGQEAEPFGIGTIITTITAVTGVTATSPCPTSACSKSC